MSAREIRNKIASELVLLETIGEDDQYLSNIDEGIKNWFDDYANNSTQSLDSSNTD